MIDAVVHRLSYLFSGEQRHISGNVKWGGNMERVVTRPHCAIIKFVGGGWTIIIHIIIIIIIIIITGVIFVKFNTLEPFALLPAGCPTFPTPDGNF
jgi:hypothetical protein